MTLTSTPSLIPKSLNLSLPCLDRFRFQVIPVMVQEHLHLGCCDVPFPVQDPHPFIDGPLVLWGTLVVISRSLQRKLNRHVYPMYAKRSSAMRITFNPAFLRIHCSS